jgi:nucleotide-binding universal stress UspA family protein
MFENVLVGVDGRQSGRDAIALAAQLRGDDGSLTLAHVYAGYVKPSHAITPGLAQEDRRRALELLERERAEAGVRADLAAVDAATPGGGLHVQAETQNADLVVLGSCHRSLLGRAMLGDDTRAAINGSPCAVAVAPASYGERPAPFAAIGVGYDGSPESEGALETARQLAKRTNATVRALQVVSFPNYMYTGLIPAACEDLDELLRGAERNLRALPGVEGRAEYGLAGEELASFSKDLDLLVLGSRGYGPAGRLIHGSTSGYVQRHARSAVLILPRGTRYATPPGAGEANAAAEAVSV